jgi:hypothetical protein
MMHEDLLGYLLGALDADEQDRVERALAASAELRRELERLRCSLTPLESLNDEQPAPLGLVDRVCDAVAQHDNQPPPIARPASQDLVVAANRSWSLADVAVMALLALATFTLFVPALASSRYLARKLACQDNLRALGVQLITFSDRQAEHRFPFVPLSGNRSFAGVFAPKLLESELIQRDCSQLICPGSELAEHRDGWFVPSLQEVDRADGVRLDRLRRQAGGSYAYSIGYFDEDGYRANRNAGRAFFALIADAPSAYLRGRVSANHGGRGQNICFEDGHVGFVVDPHVMCRDDPLRNRIGYAEAGVHRDDAVLLTSEKRPVVAPALPPLPWVQPAEGPAQR